MYFQQYEAARIFKSIAAEAVRVAGGDEAVLAIGNPFDDRGCECPGYNRDTGDCNARCQKELDDWRYHRQENPDSVEGPYWRGYYIHCQGGYLHQHRNREADALAEAVVGYLELLLEQFASTGTIVGLRLRIEDKSTKRYEFLRQQFTRILELCKTGG